MTLFFAEFPATTVTYDLADKPVQTGEGIVLFDNIKRKKRTTHCLENGKDFVPNLNGCELTQTDAVNVLQLMGVDYAGSAWSVRIWEQSKFEPYIERVENKTPIIHPSREFLARVLRGRSFAEAVEEMVEAEREAEMAEMRSRVKAADAFEAILREVYDINAVAGPYSRAKAAAAIELVLPDLKVTEAA